MHRRLLPFRHRFVYRLFSVLLDLDDIPKLSKRLRLFSHNRLNLFSYHDRDHGARDGSPIRYWVNAYLREAGFDPTEFRIMTHCFPRVLGYVFNPLTIYFCYSANETLRAVLYEVKNTFGEQHGYLVPVKFDRKGDQPIVQSCEKSFYVSPFIEMDATYRFRLKEPRQRLSILIRQSLTDGETLVATHTAGRRPLDDANLARAFLIYPFMTIKVIVGIHWEALMLWIKGARYYTRPAPPSAPVSIVTKPASNQRLTSHTAR